MLVKKGPWRSQHSDSVQGVLTRGQYSERLDYSSLWAVSIGVVETDLQKATEKHMTLRPGCRMNEGLAFL